VDIKNDDSSSYLPSDRVHRGYLLIFLLLDFGVFFLIDFEVTAILASAVDVHFYGLYKRLFCLLRMTELDKLLFFLLNLMFM